MSCVIMITHFVVLFHTIEHQHHDESDQEVEINSSISTFFQNLDVEENCSICDIYLAVNLVKNHTLQIEFSYANFINNKIFQKENSLTPFTFYSKQSRSPPLFII